MLKYAVVVAVIFLLSVVQLPITVNGLSVSWNTTLSPMCGPGVDIAVTNAMLECDKLMDPELSAIYEDCVRKVHSIPGGKKLDRPTLCYYSEHGSSLDRCKMAQYKVRGVTMSELIDKQQEHTWCMMKIAEPLGWEGLCSKSSKPLIQRQQQRIRDCENRFHLVTKPIRNCFRVDAPLGRSEETQITDQIYPAACLSFQYSKTLWKCLARRRNNRSLTRLTSLYIECLRKIKNHS